MIFLGIIQSEGDLWKEQRHFVISTLRDFGVGRSIIEPHVKQELEKLIEHVNEYAIAKQPLNPRRLLIWTVSNITNQIILGKRYAFDNEKIMSMFEKVSRRTSAAGIGMLSPFVISNFVQSLLKLMPTVSDYRFLVLIALHC
jgi:hypothetical protein